MRNKSGENLGSEKISLAKNLPLWILKIHLNAFLGDLDCFYVWYKYEVIWLSQSKVISILSSGLWNSGQYFWLFEYAITLDP